MDEWLELPFKHLVYHYSLIIVKHCIEKAFSSRSLSSLDIKLQNKA